VDLSTGLFVDNFGMFGFIQLDFAEILCPHSLIGTLRFGSMNRAKFGSFP
jgi:hypothetical protein